MNHIMDIISILGALTSAGIATYCVIKMIKEK